MAHRTHHARESLRTAVLLIALIASFCSVQSQTMSHEQWGFSFQVPKGWVCEHDESGAILGHETIAGMILVLPHSLATGEELLSTMQEGLEEEGVSLYPSGKIKKGKGGIYNATYGGIFQGQEVRALSYGTLSPNGGGAFVIALSTPEGYSKALSNAADVLVRSMKYPKAEAGPTVPSLAGIWVTMTKSTETTLTLAPNGQFSTGYVAEYGGTESGQWGLAREDHSSGRWTTSGSREQGTITLVYGNGKRQTIQYRVHAENGEIYWNEYWFNGDLYGRRR